MLNWAQISAFIQANPALSAATAGMVISTSYILLMIATKLGDVKPGVQALVLSAVIHVVMLAFWGSLTISGRLASARRDLTEDADVVIAVSAVVVDGENGTSDQLSGDPNGRGRSSVFNRIPGQRNQEFSRQNATMDERVALDTPDRTAESMGPRENTLPELPQDSGTTEQAPEQPLVAEKSQRSAADSKIDIEEETSESRSDVELSNTKPGRSVTDFGGGDFKPDVEPRIVRKGQEFDSEVKVSVSAPSNAERDVITENANSPVRRPSEVQVTQRRTGAAPNVVEFNEPGTADGDPNGTAPAGSGTPKFVRVGPSGLGSTGTGTTGPRTSDSGGVERKRILEFGSGQKSTPSKIASLNPGTSANSGLGGSNVERPGIAQPDFNAIPQRRGAAIPDAYKLRNPGQRQKVALKHGATKESERAVELSLQWLARHQSPEGYWDADGFDSQCPSGDRCWGQAGRGNPTEIDRINSPHDKLALETAGKQADTGLTALVVLTFLGAGYTHEEGQFADNIDRALRWMIRQQLSDGYLGGKASHYEKMYCHGMATYALGEACGMMVDAEHDDPQLRRALAKAVRYIIAMQNPRDGGWRYLNGNLANQESDMSMFGWQLMALKSAELAGIPIPAKTQSGMERFISQISQGKQNGLASYRPGEKPKASMTAEALFCRQVLGVGRNSPSSQEAIEFLSQHPPKPETQDLYYWYYGTLAIYQYGGEPWALWNDRLRDTLVATQLKTGHAAGSWDPRDNWSRHGGRIYSTALSTMCLEVYYRFLPLYQSHDRKLDARLIPTQVE